MYMGFPQNDFPYTYYLDDTKLSSPLLMGTRLLGCAGFTILPLPIDIDFFTEVLPGINLCWLWDGKAGRQSISTKVFASFYTAIVVGAGWRFVNVSVRGEYDALLGFSYTGNIGFNLDLEIIKGFFTGGIKK